MCVHYLVAKGTIDEKLFTMLNKKISVLGETLDGVSGKTLEIEGGEQNRNRMTERMKQISEESYVADIMRMIHIGEEKYAEEDDDMMNAFIKQGEKNKGDSQPDDVVVDLNLEADEILKNVEEKKKAQPNKFQNFFFKK